MDTQINPETAVGIEKRSTNPATVSGAWGLKRSATPNAARGITIWEKKKKIPTVAGFATAAPISLNRSFRAPDNVITAKSQGTKNLSGRKETKKRETQHHAQGSKEGHCPLQLGI